METGKDMPTLWPGWKTVRLIGRGSFGAVYEIERDMLGEKEKAALKVITIPQSDGDIREMVSDGYDEESITSTFREHLKSIVAEYSLMRKLNGSANVVNCDDVRYVQHDDGIGWDIFIKMELLTPLTEALPLSASAGEIARVGRDLCRALVQCRRFDIVHRDIKPQNIFVSPLGDYKLGDFGVAKTVEKTSGGTKIGTYKYMAPEVYNNRPYGAGADIYSLGLVLYWLLNERRLPFLPLPPEKLTTGLEEKARLRRFSGEEIPAPAHGGEELKRIVLKACAFDPQDRWQSAEYMLREREKLCHPELFPASPAAAGTVSAGAGVPGGPSADDEDTGRNSLFPPASVRVGVPDGPSADDEGTTIGVFKPAAPVPPAPAPVSPVPARADAPDGPSPDDGDGTIGVFGRKIDKTPAPASAEAGAPGGPSSDGDGTTIGVFNPAAPVPRAPTPTPEEDATVPVATNTSHAQKAAPAEAPKKKVPLWSPIVGVLAAAAILLLVLLPKNRSTPDVTPTPTPTPNPVTTPVPTPAPTPWTEDDWTWSLDDGVLTISGTGNVDVGNYGDDRPWLQEQESIDRVVIGDGISGIGGYAFWYCTGLSSVEIPSSVTTIGSSAFQWCTSLTSVTIPEGVTTIGFDAFRYCTGLSSVEIPSSVTSISSGAFSGCDSLASVEIPSSVTAIGGSAFESCTSLTSVTIPEGVTTIGGSAFKGCSALLSVEIPEGVTTIGHKAFWGCARLSSVEIPSSVTVIYNSVFEECTELKSVTIPTSVTTVSRGAFYGCDALKDVYYTGSAEQWAAVSIEGDNDPLLNATIHFNSK